MLINPNYVGRVRYSVHDSSRYFEAEGRHQPIIGEDTFTQVQDKIGKISKIAYTKRPTSGVYFSGVLYCSECGLKYSAKWNYSGHAQPRRLSTPSYRCNTAMKDRGCTTKYISHTRLEKAFVEYIERYGELIADDVEQTNAAPDHSAEIAAIATEIGKIEKVTKEIMGMLMSGNLEFSEYRDMVKVGNERRGELEARLEQIDKALQCQRVRFSKAEIVSNIHENWNELDNEQRQQFVQKFIRKIIAHSEKPKFGRSNDVVIDEIIFNEF
jgi:site-specific DNA recombinase